MGWARIEESTRVQWFGWAPELFGPSSTGGPFQLQVWQRNGTTMDRVYAGDGPAFSPELGAWAVVVAEGRHLRWADDADGSQL